jgi:hypothetical protein
VRSPRGRRLGTVSRIGLYSGSGRAVALYVDPSGRRRPVRPIVVEPSCVTSVDPWNRSLVVDLPPEPTPAARTRVVSLAAAGALRTALRRTSRVTTLAWRRTVDSARRVAPHVRRFVFWSAAATAYVVVVAGRFAAWAIFHVVRVTVLLLVAALSGLVRVCRRVGPPLGPAVRRVAGEARTTFVRHRPTSDHIRQVRRAVVSRSHVLRGR